MIPRVRFAESPSELAVAFEFIAEGAANIVFRIVKFDPTLSPRPIVFDDSREPPVHRHPLNMVLRVPKQKLKVQSASTIVDELELRVKPLFPGVARHFIMEHQPVHVDRDVIDHLDRIMRIQTRRTHSGDLQAPQGFTMALLIPNMEHYGPNGFMIEFKPKWLDRSPYQGKLDYRCRTCAIRAYRISVDEFDITKPYSCPLGLVAGDAGDISRVIEYMVERAFSKKDVPKETEQLFTRASEHLCRYLQVGEGHDLLDLLRSLQNRLDPHVGPPALGLENKVPNPTTQQDIDNLCLAMTLRDCSVFLRVTWKDGDDLESRPPEIECKLGDLDFKDERKLADWRDKESTLRSGGWYEGREKGRGGLGLDMEERCWLAREFRRSSSS